MKHIFFILAHKNLGQVVHLAKTLSLDFDCLIHVDKKYGEIDLEFNYSLHQKNIYFTSRRLSIDLASFSMIEVIQLMLDETKRLEFELNVSYSYVGLISGQCFPIQKISRILEILDETFPKLIIDSVPISKANWIESVYSRHRFIILHNFINKNFNNRFLNNLLKFPIYSIEMFYTLIYGSPSSLSNALGLRINCGSAWWILPKNLLNDIFTSFDKNPQLKKIYRHILTPEEHFFQTMIATYFPSKYEFDLKLRNGQTLVFFDHPVYGKSKSGHPFILKSQDFPLISESNKLFARKFDMSQDNEIIDIIEKTLL